MTAAASLRGFLLACLGGLAGRRRSAWMRQPAALARRAGRGEAVVGTNPDEPADRPGGDEGDDGLTTAAELTQAVLASGIRRTFVLSAGGPGIEPGSVALARGLAARSATVILVDLGGGRSAAGAMGIAVDAPGLADLAEGTASFADVIHRDRWSAVNVLSGGILKMDEGGFGLAEVFEALAEAYDCTIVDCEAMIAGRLSAMMDEHSAVVISMPQGAEQDAIVLLKQLEAAGHTDALVMQRDEPPADDERRSAAG